MKKGETNLGYEKRWANLEYEKKGGYNFVVGH